jgi:3-dehydroquinate synthetase
MLGDLALAELERSDLVVAMGGGILGDVAGFAAGLHRRGVRIVQCPTTLLAMVDASVGGKTGVNLRAGIDGSPVLLKNAVGVFHQPSLVVADVDALASLEPRELRCGLAECIKHAAISGGSGQDLLSLAGLTDAMPRLLLGDAEVLASLVEQNVGLKARVVAGDERELAIGSTPGRRALNLGHTFAHAIEGCEGTRVEVGGSNQHPKHGEAVGIGLIAAARLAELLGVGSANVRVAIEMADDPGDAVLLGAWQCVI